MPEQKWNEAEARLAKAAGVRPGCGTEFEDWPRWLKVHPNSALQDLGYALPWALRTQRFSSQCEAWLRAMSPVEFVRFMARFLDGYESGEGQSGAMMRVEDVARECGVRRQMAE